MECSACVCITLQLATESIDNIRTVAQLTKEQHFHEEYCKVIRVPYK